MAGWWYGFYLSIAICTTIRIERKIKVVAYENAQLQPLWILICKVGCRSDSVWMFYLRLKRACKPKPKFKLFLTTSSSLPKSSWWCQEHDVQAEQHSYACGITTVYDIKISHLKKIYRNSFYSCIHCNKALVMVCLSNKCHLQVKRLFRVKRWVSIDISELIIQLGRKYLQESIFLDGNQYYFWSNMECQLSALKEKLMQLEILTW